MITRKTVLAGSILAVACFTRAEAVTYDFTFGGSGVSGTLQITAAPDTVLGDPVGAYTISGVTGQFSDSNAGLGIIDATVTGLVPISPVSPPVGAPAPVSLSYLTVINPPPQDSAISYDNLYYPGGSPVTCAGYPLSGGVFDVYGVLFTLANGDAVDVWSNGTAPGVPLEYGVAVVSLGTSNTVLDYQASIPEPQTWSLMVLGVGAMGAALRRRRPADAV